MTVTVNGLGECVQGVDVSRWQGGINFNAFNLDFAYIKASGGDDPVHGLYKDGYYDSNSRWPTPWGPYHFASNMTFGPLVEADHFCSVILNSSWASLPTTMKLPPALDWEPNRALHGTGDWVLQFLRRVEQRTGVHPIIYTGYATSLDRVPELLVYDLWQAAYVRDVTQYPCLPWGQRRALWQYSSTGSISGIQGNCDTDYATVEWFNRVRGVGSTPAPAPTPQPNPFPFPSTPDPTPTPAPTPEPTPTTPVQEDDDMAFPFKFDDNDEWYYINQANEAEYIQSPDEAVALIKIGVLKPHPLNPEGLFALIDQGPEKDALRARYPNLPGGTAHA